MAWVHLPSSNGFQIGTQGDDNHGSASSSGHARSRVMSIYGRCLDYLRHFLLAAIFLDLLGLQSLTR